MAAGGTQSTTAIGIAHSKCLACFRITSMLSHLAIRGHVECRQHSVSFNTKDFRRDAQAFGYGTEEWDEFHTHARNSIESLNHQVKSGGTEDIDTASQRRVRGFADAQMIVTLLLTNFNIRKTVGQLAQRAPNLSRHDVQVPQVIVEVDPTLRSLLPRRDRGDHVIRDAAPTETVAHLLQVLGVPVTEVGAASVDGHRIGHEALRTTHIGNSSAIDVEARERPQPSSGHSCSTYTSAGSRAGCGSSASMRPMNPMTISKRAGGRAAEVGDASASFRHRPDSQPPPSGL